MSNTILVLDEFGYEAGGWRVEYHPRILADMTGDGKADIVGFGNAGVYVSLNKGDGTFKESKMVLNKFGYEAGGWRVDKHPRFLTDLTGDRKADIIAFGDSGVYVSLNKGDGTFQEPKMVLKEFGYEAGGWRVDKHPRFLADLTGDGKADVIAFGDSGVYVSLNKGDGTFKESKMVLNKFGYEAGGWRVDKHPRFLADLTGDGKADIIAFGDSGVYVSLNKGDGTFQEPKLVLKEFGYEAGGWRVDKHPRILADMTGDGKADIIAFGNAGVYVSLNKGDGTFKESKLILNEFGYEAGGWQVDKHPRFLADLTGDEKADIIAFGNAGVYVSRNIETPVLAFRGKEDYEVNGITFTRIMLEISNYEKFPDELFSPAPDLPPCGNNHTASRTWVDIYNGTNNQRIYGFCALSCAKDLTDIWFAVQKGQPIPEVVYVKMTDRRTGTVYQSNNLSLSQCLKTAMLIITSRDNLRNKYGQASFDQIGSKIGVYIKALENAGLGAALVYVDSADSLKEYGLSPVDPGNASDIKKLIDELDKKLSPTYTLIIGGHSIIPFHILPNPCGDDGDTEVNSDSPYASRDNEFLVPERILARLPDDSTANASFLISLIENITVRVKKARRDSFGYSASVWEKASEAVYATIEYGQDLKLSPPTIWNSIMKEWINSKGYFYFNLHGSEDTGNWYGQGDNGYPVAFTPENLKDINVENAVICTEACYGANIIEKKVDDALSLKFLAKKAACFVGSTKIAYGPWEPPSTDADLIVLKFFEHIKKGLDFGEAFLKAKQDFAQESIIKKGYLDTTEQKTLLEFVIFADPSARMEEI
ncbi:MAG: hypothetical protein QG610_390 [Euryarchaeota archaeon]|nr:hypothetical protein [Euryarchaeota archaeon]